MTVEICIVPFTITDDDSRVAAEGELAALLNERWVIISQGGNDGQAYFVLQKGEVENTRPFPFSSN